jgi:hypothetical protein
MCYHWIRWFILSFDLKLKMRFQWLVVVNVFVLFVVVQSASDVRQRFEGLIGKTVQAAWRQIDREGHHIFCSIGKRKCSFSYVNFSTRPNNGSHAWKCTSVEENHDVRLCKSDCQWTNRPSFVHAYSAVRLIRENQRINSRTMRTFVRTIQLFELFDNVHRECAGSFRHSTGLVTHNYLLCVMCPDEDTVCTHG